MRKGTACVKNDGEGMNGGVNQRSSGFEVRQIELTIWWARILGNRKRRKKVQYATWGVRTRNELRTTVRGIDPYATEGKVRGWETSDLKKILGIALAGKKHRRTEGMHSEALRPETKTYQGRTAMQNKQKA